MSHITEQAAYIRGLAVGLGIGDETKEHRVLSAIIALLDDIAAQMEKEEKQIETLSTSLDTVVEDVAEMQDLIFEDLDDYDLFGIDKDDDEESMREIDCPQCGEGFLVDEEIMLAESELACPNCGSMVDLNSIKPLSF